MPGMPTVDEVWKMPIPGSNKPLGLDLLEFSFRKSRNMGFLDPDCAAAAAMLHLYLVTERDLHIFVDPGGDVNLLQLRAWSREVISNHLYSQGRKNAKECERYEITDNLEDSSDPQASNAELWLKRLDLQIAQLCALHGLSQEKQFRVMARLLEITNEDLAALEEITVKGIEKFFAWLRREIDTGFESFPKKITRRFRNPADDEPLATADTPLLAEKLTSSEKDAQHVLVRAIDGLAQPLRFPFFSRVIGYWDCSLASVLDVSIPRQEMTIVTARELLEKVLKDPPKADGGSGRAPDDDALRHQVATSSQANSGGNRMATHLSHLSSEGLQALLKSLEQNPGETFTQLHQDPDLQASLAIGRRQHVEPAALPRALSVAERLWRYATQTRDALQEQLEEAVAWLVPLEPFLVRGHDGEPLVYVFAQEVGRQIGKHCLLLQVKGQQLELLYPEDFAQETRSERLEGIEVPLMVTPDETRLHLVLLWLPPVEFAKLEALQKQVPYAERPAALETWVKSLMLDAPEGVTWDAIEIEVPV